MGQIAKWIAKDQAILSTLFTALDVNSDFSLKVVGHSLGAGIAALVSIYWENHNTFKKYQRKYKYQQKQPNQRFMRCFAYAPPPILSEKIREKGEDFVYSIVNEDDMVPRLNVKCIYGAMDVVGIWNNNNYYHHHYYLYE